MSIFRNHQRELGANEAEVTAMITDLSDAHHDTLPQLRESLESWTPINGHEDELLGVSRRNFLTTTGLLAAGGLLVAAGTASATTAPRAMPTAQREVRAGLVGGTSAPLDVTVAALAASLENLAVATYAAALSAAKAGKLGKVPAAVGTFVTTAMAQHKDHAAAWNALVTAAGYKKITAPNAILAKTVNASFAKVTDIAGVAMLALTLEEAAAATYLEAIEAVSGRTAIATAATIQPVEMQHAAILNFILGQYPVPEAFSAITGAAKVADAPAVSKN